jgi:predicted small secreted protein
MRKIIFAAIALAIPLMTAACNTVEGFGQDLQKAGNNLEDEAQDAKN